MDIAASGGGWAGLLFWFFAILVLIPGSLWLLKRSRLGGAIGGQGPVKVISQTPLGTGQRLVIVEVRHGSAPPQTMMLGVTPHQVNLVALLPSAPGQQLQETV
jgi:flagellar biogenesis protein FliO